MSSSSSSANRDVFADIAARHTEKRDAGLIEPQPPHLSRNELPWNGAAADLQLPEKLDNAEKLAAELEAYRQQYRPFLADLAPDCASTRRVCHLQRFQWRLETGADREDAQRLRDGRGDWEEVTIPHYGGPIGRAAAWYRTTFEKKDALAGRDRAFVHFQGVDYITEVFVNGHFLGSHEGFFAPFEFDLTPFLTEGANTLLVRVVNDAACRGNNSWGQDIEGDKIYAATGPGYDDPELGWHHCPPGMGIYQDVCLEGRPRCFVRDVFVRPLPAQQKAEVRVEIFNADSTRRSVALDGAVFGQNFEAVVLDWQGVCDARQLGPGVSQLRFEVDMPDFRWWTPETPWLYQVQLALKTDDETVADTKTRQFGMRSFEMAEDSVPKGRFYLNGSEIRLRGANTMGHLQQCVMQRDWKQLADDILLAKIAHLNFFRLTQRPVQPEIYDYCDRLGLMTQTDLPLFGCLPRNKFHEAVRQAGEMETLIRSHPCNVLVSYINEPFPNAREQPERYLFRDELEAFFTAASIEVRLQNPDRVIKPVDGDYDPPAPGLPDNHCYTGWYNGHGLQIGALHRGYWQRVKPGWMYGCGEYGAEGLEDEDLMRKCYPEHWLPQTPDEEAEWSPDRIVRAQTGRFHYMWFDTQETVGDWIRASQRHQEWANRIMTEAMRRDSRMNTTALHLFIDAFPSGWMKAVMDSWRRPKPAFFTFRDNMTPLMVNLRSDRNAWYAGETARVEAWVCNDTREIPGGAELRYRFEVDGAALSTGACPARVPDCDSAFQGILELSLPEVRERTRAHLVLALVDGEGAVRHHTSLPLTVLPPCAIRVENVMPLGPDGGKAASLLDDLNATRAAPETARVWLVDDPDGFAAEREAVLQAVKSGATAVLLEWPAGTYEIAGDTIRIDECGMNPRQFASRKTGHRLVDDFEPEDFRFWYDASQDCVTPLLSTTFRHDAWNPILKSGNGVWRGDWGPTFAVAERTLGQGRLVLCQLHLAGRIDGNPVADTFARRLLAGPGAQVE